MPCVPGESLVAVLPPSPPALVGSLVKCPAISKEEQGQGDEEAAFLMVGATEREARSMHPFAAGLD